MVLGKKQQEIVQKLREGYVLKQDDDEHMSIRRGTFSYRCREVWRLVKKGTHVDVPRASAEGLVRQGVVKLAPDKKRIYILTEEQS